jgi:hypothetical protein
VSQTGVANLRTASAARLRAMWGAPAFRRFGRGSRQATVTSLAQLQAMLPGTWIEAGVTRPILSQSSDSTSRLGRNTEGNDAQSRPGAGCKPARRHRTRSASESALAKASLDERDFRSVTELGTNVKIRCYFKDGIVLVLFL